MVPRLGLDEHQLIQPKNTEPLETSPPSGNVASLGTSPTPLGTSSPPGTSSTSSMSRPARYSNANTGRASARPSQKHRVRRTLDPPETSLPWKRRPPGNVEPPRVLDVLGVRRFWGEFGVVKRRPANAGLLWFTALSQSCYSSIDRISPSNSPSRLVNCAAAAPLMARWS